MDKEVGHRQITPTRVVRPWKPIHEDPGAQFLC